MVKTEAEVRRNTLITALDIISGAVPLKKSPSPIFEGLAVYTKDNTLYIQKVAPSNGIIYRISDAKLKDDGVFVVFADVFIRLVKSMPDTDILLKQHDRQVEIQAGDIHMSIPTLESSQYPFYQVPERNGARFTMPQEMFSDGIIKTVFAAEYYSETSIQRGVLINGAENHIRLIASDKARIVMRRVGITSGNNIGAQAVLDSIQMQNLAHALKSNRDIDMYMCENTAIFETEDFTTNVGILAGPYPDILNILEVAKRTVTDKIKVKTSELSSCLHRVMLMKGNESQNISVLLTPSVDRLAIECTGSRGELHEKLATDGNIRGFSLRFNARVAHECIRSLIDNEYLYLAMSNEKFKPLLITPTDGDDFIHMIMPVNK